MPVTVLDSRRHEHVVLADVVVDPWQPSMFPGSAFRCLLAALTVVPGSLKC